MINELKQAIVKLARVYNCSPGKIVVLYDDNDGNGRTVKKEFTNIVAAKKFAKNKFKVTIFGS